ncbi:hypothetical protein ACFFGF_04850 [Asaia lannensis]|uniref:Uncharacterized protein n=1 Tax=Asaia lannensis NBRC 102526 TaxID=1307926 RepID=A0ABT1CIF9_9PROT|nr:hypothetical protein [Asaia lannensis]MCO6160657.1 hypothetical protein [Asaia lannensis NBRC 102526]
MGRSERQPVRRNHIDEIDVFGIVNNAVYRAGSQTAFARQAGVSKQALNNQIHSRDDRNFTEEVLAAAGLRRVVTVHYEFIEEARA